jgi:hypothetical protein
MLIRDRSGDPNDPIHRPSRIPLLHRHPATTPQPWLTAQAVKPALVAPAASGDRGGVAAQRGTRPGRIAVSGGRVDGAAAVHHHGQPFTEAQQLLGVQFVH